jgi:hypothetical protein
VTGFPHTKAMLKPRKCTALSMFIFQQIPPQRMCHNLKKIQRLVFIFVTEDFSEEYCSKFQLKRQLIVSSRKNYGKMVTQL